MADYIRSDIICQAYVRIDMPFPDERTVESLRETLFTYANKRSNFLLEDKVEARIEVKDGSIIEYLTIVGSIYVLLQGYPKFREGVKALYSDVRRLTEAMTLEAQFVTGAKTDSVLHSEARTGLIGKLRDVLDRIESIKDSYGIVKISTLSKRLNSCMDDTVKLLESLTQERDRRYIAVNLHEIVFELSDSPPEKPKLQHPEPNAPEIFKRTRASFLALLDDFSSAPLAENEDRGQAKDVIP